jgi:hypothetical protein
MIKKLLSLVIILITIQTTLIAQESKDDSAAAAQSNNPLANMTAFVLQNYYMPKLNDAPVDSYQNTSWIRFAKPISDGKQLLRASLPISSISTPTANDEIETTSGLGDLNVFYSFNFISKPTITVGIGPNLTVPTATATELGTGKWQGGLALVAFVAKSPVFQYGALLTWQHSFAGNEDRNQTNNGAIQPFYFWQLGKGTYLRGAPIWYMDFENENYSFPIALGIGKIVKVDKNMFNLFVEPQYSIWTRGTQPQFQLMMGIIFDLL